MAKVFVMGASLPLGGAFMAYHVGRIAALEFGLPLVDVIFKEAAAPIFFYDQPFESLPVDLLPSVISQADLLISYPALSRYMHGLRLPGKKLMYAQGFQAFSWVDCQFDRYVSVSTCVQTMMRELYQISTRRIPPFIDLGAELIPRWIDRPELSFLVYTKNLGQEHRLLKSLFLRHLQRHVPNATVACVDAKEGDQRTLFGLMRSNRYFVNLSIGEGFGLPALEAMGLGLTVLGLDGIGGRDYLRRGSNSLTYPIKDWQLVLDSVEALVQNPELAQKLSTQAQTDAAAYSYSAFHAAWKPILAELLSA